MTNIRIYKRSKNIKIYYINQVFHQFGKSTKVLQNKHAFSISLSRFPFFSEINAKSKFIIPISSDKSMEMHLLCMTKYYICIMHITYCIILWYIDVIPRENVLTFFLFFPFHTRPNRPGTASHKIK